MRSHNYWKEKNGVVITPMAFISTRKYNPEDHIIQIKSLAFDLYRYEMPDGTFPYQQLACDITRAVVVHKMGDKL